MNTVALKKQQSGVLVTVISCAEDRVSIDGHRDTLELSPGCSDVVPQAHKKLPQSHSHQAAHTHPNMTNSARSVDYLKNCTEKIEHSKTKGNAGSKFLDTSLREVNVDFAVTKERSKSDPIISCKVRFAIYKK
jgi:hypothetical protein